ncbi:MAG TPA: NAD(P)-binding protein [Bryobacteraceae bacterium]|nr:NAD(P)-binding protein [Bryobacteraceae bacterium]
MSSSSPLDQTYHRSLGMHERISRRDYLNSTLLASGSLLLGSVCPMDLMAQNDWDGYGGVGDYSSSNGNTFEVMTEAHKIRDRVYEPLPAGIKDAGELYDCVIVGGGISGLAAALFFKRQYPKRTCLVLENHGIFGGEARRNEFLVEGQRLIAHQGSAMIFPPLAGTFLEDFYNSIGINQWPFPYQAWSGNDPEIPLGRTPYPDGARTSGFFFGPKFGQSPGKWVKDPWGTRLEGAPISEEARRELAGMRDADAPRRRKLPERHGDSISRHLDSITLEQDLMETYGLSRETVRTFLSPVSGGGSGLGADALSAYAEYAADVLLPWDYPKGAQMFPGGNAGVARHIVKELIPGALPGPRTLEGVCKSAVDFSTLDRAGQSARIRVRATAISVQHEGEPETAKFVRVVYARAGEITTVRARSVIMAGGSWTTKHIVKDLPAAHREAYAQFYRAPCLMANVAVRNWRFLYKLGISECQWFEGIGNYTAVRKMAAFGPLSPSVSPDSPVVLTLKILFSSPGLPIGEQVARGRAELISTPFREYERRIREQLAMLFSSGGFDSRRDIAGIILNRWGHAYLSAQPGFFFGKDGTPPPGEILRNHLHGRIAFANSDLTGIMDHRASILEARRAVEQLAERRKL